MSPKSSLPQPAKSVSVALTPDRPRDRHVVVEIERHDVGEQSGFDLLLDRHVPLTEPRANLIPEAPASPPGLLHWLLAVNP